MDTLLLLYALNASDLVLGVALVVIGGAIVRPIDAASGYLTIGAGAVWLGTGVCTYALNVVGTFAPEASEPLRQLGASTALGTFAMAGMLLRAAARLARALRAEGGGA